MNEKMKKRLTGAVVIVAASLLFLMLIIDSPDDPDRTSGSESSESGEIETRVFTVDIGERSAKAELPAPTQAAEPDPVVAPEKSVPKPKPGPAAKSEPEPQPVEKPAVNPAAKPKTVSQPVAETERDWIVQIGSYSVRSGALLAQDQAKKRGYEAYIVEADIDGKTWYRVRVGPAMTRDKVESTAARISSSMRVKAKPMAAN